MKKMLIIAGLIVIVGFIFMIVRNNNSVLPKQFLAQLPLETVNYSVVQFNDGIKITLYPRAMNAEAEETVDIESRYKASEQEVLNVIYNAGAKQIDKIPIYWERK